MGKAFRLNILVNLHHKSVGKITLGEVNDIIQIKRIIFHSVAEFIYRQTQTTTNLLQFAVFASATAQLTYGEHIRIVPAFLQRPF